MQIDKFTRAYIECALWSTNDGSDEAGGDPLDDNYGIDDVAPESLAGMVQDCQAFQLANLDRIGTRSAEAGHDFWLTRNGHGAGFWDGDWVQSGDALTRASKRFGEVNLYVGDDGLIYQS